MAAPWPESNTSLPLGQAQSWVGDHPFSTSMPQSTTMKATMFVARLAQPCCTDGPPPEPFTPYPYITDNGGPILMSVPYKEVAGMDGGVYGTE